MKYEIYKNTHKNLTDRIILNAEKFDKLYPDQSIPNELRDKYDKIFSDIQKHMEQDHMRKKLNEYTDPSYPDDPEEPEQPKRPTWRPNPSTKRFLGFRFKRRTNQRADELISHLGRRLEPYKIKPPNLTLPDQMMDNYTRLQKGEISP